MHFTAVFRRVQSQKALGLGTLVHSPCDYRQTVAADQRGIDLSESRLLITGQADESSPSVAKGFGDVRGLLEDVGAREGAAADSVESPQRKRVEARNQNPIAETEFVYQGNDLS